MKIENIRGWHKAPKSSVESRLRLTKGFESDVNIGKPTTKRLMILEFNGGGAKSIENVGLQSKSQAVSGQEFG